MGPALAIGAKIASFLFARPTLLAILGLSLVAGFFFIQDQRHSRQLAEANQASAEKEATEQRAIAARAIRDRDNAQMMHANLAILTLQTQVPVTTVIREINNVKEVTTGCIRDAAFAPVLGLRREGAHVPGGAQPAGQGVSGPVPAPR